MILLKCLLGRGIAEEMSRRQKQERFIQKERPEEAPFWFLAELLFGKANCNG